MNRPPRLLAAVLCTWLAACASTKASRHEAAEAPETVVSSWKEACADERSLTVLCGENACAFVYCRDVQHPLHGEVVRVRGGSVVAPAAPGSPRRWWGRGLGLPGDREPVFIIPWYSTSNPHRTLPDMRRMLSRGPWVLHHIFPQEQGLAQWFHRNGVDIHRHTIPIPQSLHTYLHSGGPRGGQWNDAWRQFVLAHRSRKVSQEEIWAHAFQLMGRYKLVGPLVPYR